MIKHLPDDIISEITQFLTPCEFYKLKTAVPMDNSFFWWNRDIDAIQVLDKKNISMLRYILSRTDDVNNTLQLALSTRDIELLIIIANHVIKNFASYTGALFEIFAENNDFAAFYTVLTSNMIDIDLLDTLYVNNRSKMTALIMTVNPRVFINYMFGYNTTTPDMIRYLGTQIKYFSDVNKKIITELLEKYFNWYWNEKTNDVTALPIITAIVELKLFDFEPDKYLKCALRARSNIYLEYLLYKGAKIDLKKIDDFDKMSLFFHFVFARKIEYIALFILFIIFMILNQFQPTRPTQYSL